MPRNPWRLWMVDPPGHRRVRARLMVLYAAVGMTMGTWLSRLPSVRDDALGVSTGTMAVVLLVGAIGGFVAVVASGPLVTRFGGRRMLYLAAWSIYAAYGLIVTGMWLSSLVVVGLGVVLLMVGQVTGNIPSDMEGAAAERLLGRPILSQFHAAYSAGLLVGSLVGAAFAAVGIAATWHFVVVATVLLGVRLWCIPAVIIESDDAARRLRQGATRSRSRFRTGAMRAWLEPRIVLIGLIVLTSSLAEWGANNWTSLATVDAFHASEAAGALVYGCVQAAGTLMRWFGPQIIARRGRVLTLRAALLGCAAGVIAFAASPNIGLAAVGAAAWGAGAALAYPICVSAAAEDPLRSPGRISVISTFGSAAQLIAPSAIGALGEIAGLRYALLVTAPPLLLALLATGRVRPSIRPSPPMTSDGGQG